MLLKKRAFRAVARDEVPEIEREVDATAMRIDELVELIHRELEAFPGERVKCPQCGSLMVVRTAYNKYWKCPDCGVNRNARASARRIP